MKLYEKYIKPIPNFPIPNVTFQDITPLLMEPKAFTAAIDDLVSLVIDIDFDAIVSPASRGFIFGCPVAYKLKKPIIIARKSGSKLPRKSISASYDLEYGRDRVFIHEEDLKKFKRILILDDILATGGTAKSIISLIKKTGSDVAAIAVLGIISDVWNNFQVDDCKILNLINF